MNYDNLNKDELVSRIEKLEHDLINLKRNNEKLVNAEELANQQHLILKFLKSMAIPSADKSTVDEFSKILLKAVKEYTGAVLATFSYYQPDKKELLLLHIEAEQNLLKIVLKIAGDNVVKTASPVDDETYRLITKDLVGRYSSFTEVSFGAIPKLIDKAIRKSTGIDRLYPVAHVIEGKLYGTTMLAFKKGQTAPSIELLESYAHLMSVSLRRYNAEKKITETKQFYENIIEKVQDGIWVTDENDVIYYANEAMAKIAGIPRDKIQGYNVMKDYPEEITGKLISFYKQAKEEKQPIWYDVNLKTAAGKDTWQNGWLIPQYEKDTFKGIICTTRDITEHKKAELALIESEEKYSTLINTANEAIGVAQEGVLVFINKEMSTILGLPEDAIIGKPFIDFIWPDDREMVLANHQRRLAGEKVPTTYDFRIIGAQNMMKWVLLSANKMQWEGKPATMNLFTDITERKYAEEALKVSEEKYRLIDSASIDYIYSYDLNGRFTHANPSLIKFWGLPIDQILGKTHRELGYPEEICQEWDELHRKVYETNTTVFAKTYSPNRSGEFRHYEVNLNPLYDAEGKIIGITGVTRDITERLQIEDELLKNQKRYEKAQAMGHVGNWEYLPETSNFWGSDEAKRIYGFDLDSKEFTVEKVESCIPDRERVHQALIDLIENDKKYDLIFDIITNDKGIRKTIHSIAGLERDDQGKAIKVTGVISDITQSKQNEDNLKSQKQRLQNIIEGTNVGTWEWNIQTSDVIFNEKWANLIGYTLEEISPLSINTWINYVHPEDLEKSNILLNKHFNGELDYYHFESRMKHKNGNWIWVLDRGKVVSWTKDGKPEWMYGTHQDITDRKQAEDELVKAKEKAEEADRLKSAFLANMSHEIRTPMNGILGFTSLLKEPNLTGKEQQKFIEIIEKSGERMLTTINDIVDISKIESGQVEVLISDVNLNKKMDELLDFFSPEAKKKDIQLSITNRVPDQQANFKSDKEKLNSVLTNLIKNAIKYTPSGSIEFGYSIVESVGQNELEFYVKDTGIGIPKERQKAIFERFTQADIEDRQVYEGSGLGLAISKAYVEMLGGRIWVESEEGVGSIFCFTIPYNKSNKKAPERNTLDTNEQLPLKKELKVLIADDDEFAITFLRIALKEYAKEILVAKTGIQAMKMCRENPDTDIVLMDIKIPGIDGYEATRQIREFNKEVFILAQTAYAQSGDREKSIQAGCDDYISKPIDKVKLLEIINNHFKI